MAASDPEAVALARQVLEKMGGQEAWESTRYLSWHFFGRRFHVWDKRSGNIRIEYDHKESGAHHVILMNLNSREGKAWADGEPISDPAALGEILESGYAMWVNDSYWLFMPYKLLDPGVTLTMKGPCILEDGRSAHCFTMTFEKVGLTPENKYDVLVADDSGLVEQWNFYSSFDDEEARFKVPWKNWKKYGRILLSDDRGRGSMAPVQVFDALPISVFTDPADPGLNQKG